MYVCMCVRETDNCVKVFAHMEPEINGQREAKEKFCTVAHKHAHTHPCTLLHRSEVSLCLWQTFNYRRVF